MNIEEFYNKYVEGKLEEISKMKLKERKNRKITICIVGVLLVAVLLGRIINDLTDIEIVGNIAGFLFMFGFSCILIFQFKKTTSSRDTMKQNILMPFFNECFENLDYQYDGKFNKEELKRILGIIPVKADTQSNDIFNLKIEGKEIKVGDILWGELENYGVFNTKIRTRGKNGILMRIPINNKNNELFIIKSKRDLYEEVLQRVSQYNSYNRESKQNKYIEKSLAERKKNQAREEFFDDKKNIDKSEYNQEFNEKFKLYNYKKEGLPQKESIVETILNIENKYNIIFRMIVKEEYLHVVIENMQIFSDTSFELSKQPIEKITPKYFEFLKKTIDEIQDIIKSLLEIEKFL